MEDIRGATRSYLPLLAGISQRTHLMKTSLSDLNAFDLNK